MLPFVKVYYNFQKNDIRKSFSITEIYFLSWIETSPIANQFKSYEQFLNIIPNLNVSFSLKSFRRLVNKMSKLGVIDIEKKNNLTRFKIYSYDKTQLENKEQLLQSIHDMFYPTENSEICSKSDSQIDHHAQIDTLTKCTSGDSQIDHQPPIDKHPLNPCISMDSEQSKNDPNRLIINRLIDNNVNTINSSSFINLLPSENDENKQQEQKDNSMPKTNFIAPALNEIMDYANEFITNSNKYYVPDLDTECESFFDYYSNTDWKICQGRQKMKDWKLALHNWLRNASNRNRRFNRPRQGQYNGFMTKQEYISESNRKLHEEWLKQRQEQQANQPNQQEQNNVLTYDWLFTGNNK